MKKFLIALAMVCTSVLAFAEASFDQIEGLIEKQQYAAAASGLEGIIKNHPQSAKAFYAMAQAQAGLGNLEKARYALDKARGLDPDLKFASKSNIESLQVAITPQAAKIETVHEHDYAWLKWVLAFGVFGLAIWYYKSEEAKKKEAEARANLKKAAESDSIHSDYHSASPSDKAYMREHNMAPKTEVPKATPTPSTYVPPAPTYVAPTPSYAPAPTQTVIHHHSSGGRDLVTGMVLGQMMGHNDHHHDTTRVIEREVIREVPAPSRDSSWDTPSTPSRSSSWDSDSSSSKSSSWDTPSSSSSSWGSSSSSSSSDSSWGSSDSSSSSSDSSSSWD